MTNETARAYAERMMNLWNLYKIYNDADEFKENKRYCPFFSEARGMEFGLKTMGIEFEYEYNEELEIVAVTVNGQTARA